MSPAYQADIRRIVKTLAPELAAAIDECADRIALEQSRLMELHAELGRLLEMVNADQLMQKLEGSELPTDENGKPSTILNDRLATLWGLN